MTQPVNNPDPFSPIEEAVGKFRRRNCWPNHRTRLLEIRRRIRRWRDGLGRIQAGRSNRGRRHVPAHLGARRAVPRPRAAQRPAHPVHGQLRRHNRRPDNSPPKRGVAPDALAAYGHRRCWDSIAGRIMLTPGPHRGNPGPRRHGAATRRKLACMVLAQLDHEIRFTELVSMVDDRRRCGRGRTGQRRRG